MSLKLILTSFLALTAIASPVPAVQKDFSTPQSDLHSRQLGGSSTKNDVVNGACRPVTYIFARGTGEPGNMGTSVGPSLERALESALGGTAGVATQGTDYPASVSGVVVGSTAPQRAQGAVEMARLTNLALRNCPTTKVVLAGYSQGAQQVHGALLNLQRGQVAAAVTFGDPLQRQAFANIDASKARVYCNAGDAVCNGQFVISAAHLSYTTTAIPQAARFIQGAIA